MTSARVLYHVARADVLERVRRYSFLLTLLFAVYLGYAAATGKILLRLGDYRGVYTSAWIGMMVAVVTTTFISLVGFYIVKNAVERDRQTRVGQILATTPLTKADYLLGKLLSNFTILAMMVMVMALASMAMQFLVGEDPRFDPWALVSPFLLIALPALAFTAGCAVVFETLRVLRGGFGNVLWFFLWSFAIGLPALTKTPQLDPMGLFTAYDSIAPAARAHIPGYTEGFSLEIANSFGKPLQVAQSFRWEGIDWTPGGVLLRLMWVAAALFLAYVAALFFDRFDPSRSRAAPGAPLPPGVPAVAEPSASAPARAAPVHLTPLNRGVVAFSLFRIFAAELRLALKGLRWWWYAVAAGLVIAGLASPIRAARGPVLAIAWIWPVLVWSSMGAREKRHGTDQLIFSAARILPRQLLACWLAGVVVAAFISAGVALRLLVGGDFAGLFALLAAVVFVPSLALALGVWSGSSKFFEALYTALWYAGPLNRAPGLDFTGGAGGADIIPDAGVYFALTAALLAAAFFGRRRQLHSC